MKLVILLIFFLLLLNTDLLAQDKNRTIKELKSERITIAPKIDGKLDDTAWQNANIAKEFVMLEPGDRKPEPNNQKTQVKVVYDDEAIYIAGYMFDSNPKSIRKQLTERDNFGTSDSFGFTINPNNDGQNEFWFIVTAAGVQIDAQVSPANGEDLSWNEVWYSNISFDDNGWYVEMKLPYSALRFSKDDNYIWGINFFRNIESKSELYTWNPIDKSVGNSTQYTGILTGINNIKPPARLSLSPFASFIYGNYDGVSDNDFSFGLDVKYGISDNFTLIATLVPDFSQAGFDDITLNLGPFEQQFAEQRQFFIEGADLLNKGDLFFSRRIGNRPVDHYEVEDNLYPNEEIINNPTEVDVINAIKVTGRTKKGLGIAVLNAITKETKATIQDTLSGTKRSVITEPLANYNVLVIDQEFNKNSSIGFVNTNVLREGYFRDANVSSLVYNLANKQNSYKISGDISSSTVRENMENTTGFASNLRLSKTKGNVRFNISHSLVDAKYDKNDLGFQRRNNYNNIYARADYRIFKPTKHFNNLRIGLFTGYFRRFSPSVYTGNYVRLFSHFTTKKQLAFGFDVGSNIGERIDYFEPRTEGRYWVKNPEAEVEGYISTDFRKKLAVTLSARKGKYLHNDESDFSVEVSPQYRVNDKLHFSYTLGLEKDFNEYGYVNTLDDGTILFGQRYVKEIENAMASKYSFNDRSSLSLVFRHYWSPVTYKDQYFELQEDGYLVESDYTGDHDLNFTSWNLDLRYIWQFARGSEMVALYRNSIINFDEDSKGSFEDNIANLFDKPIGHSFSIKVIYYLDYNRAKSWFRKS
ncbi:MAG: carbohydrate binding family 9 domain-containing protein [Flavobacteriaceae bacterium]|nr:carbohydrate binding family 9 domain-containing protein [Flavobacteriaceae bacterium]